MSNWLESNHPQLSEAFASRLAVIEQAAFLQEVSPQGGAFQKVQSRSKKKKGQAPGGAGGALTAEYEDGWVWGEDVLQDWLHSNPVSDWQREQWLLMAQQHWKGQVSRGYDLLEDAGDAIEGVAEDESDLAAQLPPSQQSITAVDGGDLPGVDPGSENPFAALALLGDDADEEELWKVLAGHGAASGQAPSQGSVDHWMKGSASSTFGRWMLQPVDVAEVVPLLEGKSRQEQQKKHTSGITGSAAAASAASSPNPAEAFDTDEPAEDGWQLVEHDAPQWPLPLVSDCGQHTDSSHNVPRAATTPTAAMPGSSETDECTRAEMHLEQQQQPAHNQQMAPPPNTVMQAEQLDRQVEQLLQVSDVSSMSR